MSTKRNDFTQNSILYNIMRLAIPMTIAQLIGAIINIILYPIFIFILDLGVKIILDKF